MRGRICVSTTMTTRMSLPQDLQAGAAARLAAWTREGFARRLWARDASLWTGGDEARWLGWLDVSARQRDEVARLRGLADEIRRDGLTHAVLLGMGGSSLAPEVMSATLRHSQS